MNFERRYSEMTVSELKTEIATLKEKARKAEQLGIVNEFAVLERKATMAEAYLLNPQDFKPGETYEIIGDEADSFKVDYLNGVFAWGHRLKTPGREEAIPISLLRLESQGE
ncbi:hypothetical protein J2S13_002404 [Oikeobacillus pervagus]|uniref:DUF1811 domain-containing protein n=1 Tax=Oikeobacillus pervagus TaxID=1325931 RepID=A0AAJ1T2I0_9BACI|nr:YfhH family protein [Oikeobacillus pervagus]MDQ0215982.1 hypothetical protein [Oikeobacillus pervagus]